MNKSMFVQIGSNRIGMTYTGGMIGTGTGNVECVGNCV